MMPSTYNAFRHRSTGAVAAYKRAVLSLWVVLTIAYVLRKKLFAEMVRTPAHSYVYFEPIPPRVVATFKLPRLSPAERRAREQLKTQLDAFWMTYQEYLVTRIQHEPILTFLVIGAVVTLVARFGPPVRAWLNDVRRV